MCGETSGRYQEVFCLGEMQPVFQLLAHNALRLTLAKAIQGQNQLIMMMPG